MAIIWIAKQWNEAEELLLEMTSENYREILLNEWKFDMEFETWMINIFKKFSIFKYATGLKFEKFKKESENLKD